MKLVLDKFGLSLRRRGNRLEVRDRDVKREFPIHEIDEIHLMNPAISVSVSSLRLALKNNIMVVLARRNGWPIGFIVPSKLSGTVRGKREQYRSYYDGRGVYLAKAFAAGKVANQSRLLNILGKSYSRTKPDLGAEIMKNADEIHSISFEIMDQDSDSLDNIRIKLMKLEADAAKIYWGAISLLIPQDLGFPGRRTRGADDPVNAMLNYGYKAMLFVEVWKSVYYAGLDPYAGFLHSDRSGRPSLVLDLMEEFRQQSVDRPVFTLLSRREITRENVMEEVDGKLQLSKVAVRKLTEAITNQLDCGVIYEGSKRPLKNVILMQARNVSRYLLRELKSYKPFKIYW